MSRFDAAFSSTARSSLNTVFGESITYTAVGGSPLSITARVSRRAASEDGDEIDDRNTIREIEIAVGTADVATPARGDKITLASGQEFKIESFNIDTNKAETYAIAIAIDDTEYAEVGTRDNAR